MSRYVIISKKNKLTEDELRAVLDALWSTKPPALVRARKKLQAALTNHEFKKTLSKSPLARGPNATPHIQPGGMRRAMP